MSFCFVKVPSGALVNLAQIACVVTIGGGGETCVTAFGPSEDADAGIVLIQDVASQEDANALVDDFLHFVAAIPREYSLPLEWKPELPEERRRAAEVS